MTENPESIKTTKTEIADVKKVEEKKKDDNKPPASTSDPPPTFSAKSKLTGKTRTGWI